MMIPSKEPDKATAIYKIYWRRPKPQTIED